MSRILRPSQLGSGGVNAADFVSQEDFAASQDWEDSVDGETYVGGDWVRILPGTYILDHEDDTEIRILLPETYAPNTYTLDTNTAGIFIDAEGEPLTGLYNTAGEYRLIREGLDVRVLPVASFSGGEPPAPLNFEQGAT